MKKLLSIALVLVMLVSLCACNKTNDSEILIGSYLPLTGPSAAGGTAELHGLEMAIEEANAAGGINGRMLKLISYDSAGTSEGATKAATRLIEQDGVKVIAGSHLSSSVLAVSSLTERAQVLHVGTGTSASWTNIGLEYTYRATANADLPIATMMGQLKDCEMDSVVLISVASEYGQSGHDSIVTACAENAIEIVADVIYQSAETDFTGTISQAMAAEADTLVLYGLGNELALLTKQLRQNGYEGLIFTTEGGANTEMFTVAGDASNGMIFSATYVIPAVVEDGATELIKTVLQKYQDKYDMMPQSDVFYRGYDKGMLIVEALKNCENPDDGESIMKAFKTLSGIELLGGSFDFTDGSGDGLKVTNTWMIMDGKIQVFDKDVALNFDK